MKDFEDFKGKSRITRRDLILPVIVWILLTILPCAILALQINQLQKAVAGLQWITANHKLEIEMIKDQKNQSATPALRIIEQ
jgi:hypothetical protein